MTFLIQLQVTRSYLNWHAEMQHVWVVKLQILAFNSIAGKSSGRSKGTEKRHQVRRARCENVMIKAERETDQHCQSYQDQACSLVRIIFIIIIFIKYLTLYITWIYPDNEPWYIQCWHKIVLFTHTHYEQYSTSLLQK